MNVSLTPQLEEFVRRKVASGLYNNASEVVREGLRLMIEREAAAQRAPDAPGDAVQENKDRNEGRG
ncbi:type II toxin-antitoxin system ParD family antitoxin [Roseospira navarrensis]|uniref:Type II toxin-antitoxin system ParD family antitoxin n=1 Tax=Roseospira navarrensis TaxID=140058 RepID=A0A7X1ZHA2_9PROT|nr:type II toxin-antitoxin system ParD family antitoxin [Roseospira navarrensis]